MLTYKSTLPLQALAITTFGVYLAVAFELSLQLTALLKLSITLFLPQIALSLSLMLALVAQFTLALSFSLPNLVVNFALALDFELTIVLGLIVVIEAIFAAVLKASLIAYAYVGKGSDLGPQVQAAIGGGWPDGTLASETVTAFLFVATSSGPYTPDQVDTAALVAPPPTPPTPPPPSPPVGSYPPPQAYETGLASVTFASQINPTTVYPADPATGTLTVDNSVGTGIGKITGVTITHHGSGYPGPAFAVVSDTVDAVSVSTATPPVVTLPNPLTIPIGQGLGVTIAGVTSPTAVLDASDASPIVITVASTAGLTSVAIAGALGNTGVNGQWFAKVLSSTTAALYSDAAYTVPSFGSGAYTGGGSVCANVNGQQCAKVLTATTIALYQDALLSVPVVGLGVYSGGTVTGGGTGAVVNPTMGGGAQAALKQFFSGLLWPRGVGPALVGGQTTFALMLGTTFDLLLQLLSNLKSRAALLASATASASIAVVPPTLTATIALALKIVAQLRANLTVKPPALGAALSAQIGIIGRLSAGISFFLGIGSVNLEIWEYTGPGSGFAAAIAAGPGASGWHDSTPAGTVVAAGVFGLTTQASAAAFGAFFGGA